jgi:hypothetical protein
MTVAEKELPPRSNVLPFIQILPEGRMRLNFHRGQQKAWDSVKRFVAILAGTQGGKTCFGSPWMHREMKRMGAGDYLAGTATFPLLNLKMLPEFLNYFVDYLKLGKFHDQTKTFTVNRPGEIKLFGEEQDVPTRVIFFSATNPESIESATAKAAWLDECGQKQFRRDTLQAVLRRLSLAQGRMLLSTTLYTLGWLKNEIYDPWVKGDPDIDIIQFDSIMNPAFPRAEYERAAGTLPPWKFDMFYRGKYSKPAGLIYDSFNEGICLIDPLPVEENWLVYVGHDFGGVNPAAMFYAVEPASGLIFVIGEYKPYGLSVTEQVAELKDITKGWRVIRRVGGSRQEEGWRTAYTLAGWPIEAPPQPEVEPQISAVYGLHKSNQLKVFNSLLGYLDEKQTFSRELDDNYQPTDKIENEKRFHFMAAERYILSTFRATPVPAGGGARVKVY